MDGYGLVFVIDSNCLVITLGNYLFTNSPGRCCIVVAVKTDRKVGMNFYDNSITAVRQQLGQWSHGILLESTARFFAGCVVDSLIGHMISPMVRLGLNVFQISKRSQGYKIVAYIFYAVFYFPFFIGFSHIACLGGDFKGSQEFKKRFIKAY